jgi:hypothetical protein
LRDSGGYWISAKQEGFEEEKLLFRLLVSSARERLYCSYPRSDEEGRAQVPSIYLFDLCRAAGLDPADPALSESVPRQPLPRLASAGARYLTPREASLASSLTGMDARELHRALGWDAERLHALRRRAEELNRFGKPGAMDGVVGPQADFLSSLRRKGLSPTALQSLAACPFKFFAHYVLGLDEPEESSEAGELDSRLKGSLYHAALAAFYRRLLGRAWPKKPGFPEAVFKEAVKEALLGLTWRELGLYPLFWDVTRERMVEALRAFLRWDFAELQAGGFRPILLEEEMRAEIRIPLPKALEGLRFRGKPDRVDVKEGAFRVVDYKTSARRESLSKLVRDGKSFQPPVYLELAGRRKELSKLRNEGARFCPIEDFLEEGAQAQDYSASDFESQREGVALRLSAMLQAAAQGVFPIRPDESAFGHCRYCPFQTLCRKNHPMTLVRARAA